MRFVGMTSRFFCVFYNRWTNFIGRSGSFRKKAAVFAPDVQHRDGVMIINSDILRIEKAVFSVYHKIIKANSEILNETFFAVGNFY